MLKKFILPFMNTRSIIADKNSHILLPRECYYWKPSRLNEDGATFAQAEYVLAANASRLQAFRCTRVSIDRWKAGFGLIWI